MQIDLDPVHIHTVSTKNFALGLTLKFERQKKKRKRKAKTIMKIQFNVVVLFMMTAERIIQTNMNCCEKLCME